MRKLIGLLIIPLLLLATPVLAASLGISPSYTDLEVPGKESATANFKVYYFTGDLQISLVDVPLRVEPETIYVEALSEPVNIQITIYGDESLGSQIYDGYVRFLGATRESVAVAVRVKVKVTNVVEGQPIPQEISPTETTISPSATHSTAPEPVPATLGFSGFVWYIYALIGLAITAIVAVTVVITKRRRTKNEVN